MEAGIQILLDSLTSAQAGLTVALLALFLGWETVNPFFGFFRGHIKERGRHVIRNLVLGALNSAVVALAFIALWAAAAAWADARDVGLLHSVRDGGPGRVVLAVALLDGWFYAWHRLNHAVPFLWRFHAVHHSDPRVDVTTSGRYHVGEILISSVVLVPVVVLFGVRLWELLLYELLAAAVGQFHHANIALPAGLDRVLRSLVVTPAMHRVHHSAVPVEMHSNFGSLLSAWDRLGRTYRLAARPRDMAFGLETARSDTLADLLRMPLDPPARPERTP